MTAKRKVNKTAKSVDKSKAKVNKKPAAPKQSPEAKALALLFHNTYEELAPSFGYETRKDTKKFKPTSANGKLMVAVAERVLAAQPKPEPPPVTEQMFKEYFFKLSRTKFVQLTTDWNESKLNIKLKQQDDYDAWLNYFKTLPPNSIKLLAFTGMDILSTEAYAALSRWHDIISNPGRIDKIHQSGLSNANGSKTKTIAQLAAENDRLGVLQATRDKIAQKLDKGAGSRDTALLTAQMTEIMTQIADYERRAGPKPETKLGSLLADMHNEPAPKRSRTKGARGTSFKSRVTIEDVEK